MAWRYLLDTECWFIGDNQRWFRCKVTARAGTRMTIQSLTGWDALRQVPWPYPDGLTFGTTGTLHARLRPPHAREP
jgi:hypothetical protein